MNTKLGEVYAAFCTHKALAIDNVMFLFGGRPIPPDDTAESLGLVDGDEIFAMIDQVGNEESEEEEETVGNGQGRVKRRRVTTLGGRVV